MLRRVLADAPGTERQIRRVRSVGECGALLVRVAEVGQCWPPMSPGWLARALFGQGATLLRAVAEFLDVPVGRPLRHLREAHRVLRTRLALDRADKEVPPTLKAAHTIFV